MRQKPELPKPPIKLGEAGLAYWNRVVGEFDIESHHIDLLVSACQQRDRADSASKAIEKSGLTVVDRFGQVKTNPAVDIERNAHQTFLRLSRELGLDIEVPETRCPSRAGTGK